MKIELTFTDSHAQKIEHFLHKRYRSKATFAELCQIAAMREAIAQAELEIEQTQEHEKAAAAGGIYES